MNTDSNEKVLLSIITINYNNADGLRKTIESVCSQAFNDYEHIIVDGGSKDGSADVIREFLADDKYSRHVGWWCSEKDGGIYNAMNKGIEKARGKFVYMLNSGDSLLPEILEKIAPYLDENMDKVVYGPVDCYLNDNFQKTTGMGSGHLPLGMMPHQGIFVPLELHKKFGVYNENYKICADREFMLRLYTNKIPFVHIPVIICNYDEGGISSTSTYAALKETYKLDKTMGMKKKSLLRFIKGLVKLCLGFK